MLIRNPRTAVISLPKTGPVVVITPHMELSYVAALAESVWGGASVHAVYLPGEPLGAELQDGDRARDLCTFRHAQCG